jgi:hypothetical protein
MKKIILLILFISSFTSYSQTIRKTIKYIDLGNLTVDFKMEVNSRSDTSYSLGYCWSNEKYSSIDDVQCQVHYTNSEIKRMITTLNSCMNYIGKGVDYNISKVGFDFTVYDWSDEVYLRKENKYVTLTKSQITKLTSFLSKIKFP